MQVLDYFQLEKTQQEFWKKQILQAKWGAVGFLVSLINDNIFYYTLGEDAKLYLLVKENSLVSFCTYSKKDCVLTLSFYWYISKHCLKEFPAPCYRRDIGTLVR